MKRLAALFKKIDQELFHQVDFLSTSSLYQRLIDQLAPLNDEQRKWLGYASSILLFLIPLMVLFGFWLNNYLLKQDIHLRESLLEKIEQFDQDHKVLTGLERTTVSRYPAKDMAAFKGILTRISKGTELNLEHIKINEFVNLSSATHILQNQIKLNFTHFTMQDLSNLLEGLLVKARVRINHIDLKTDLARKEISGAMTILHFSRGGGN